MCDHCGTFSSLHTSGTGLEEGSREGPAVAELDVEYGESTRSERLRLRAIASEINRSSTRYYIVEALRYLGIDGWELTE